MVFPQFLYLSREHLVAAIAVVIARSGAEYLGGIILQEPPKVLCKHLHTVLVDQLQEVSQMRKLARRQSNKPF